MLYRNFAIATLIAAPLIVLAIQNFLPQPGAAPRSEEAALHPDAPPPVPVPVAPPVVTPGAPAMPEPAPSFGQPMADAGAPMLAPGQGLPAAPVASSDGGNPYTSAEAAPPGSPNAEK